MNNNLIEGEDFYFNEDGFTVLTAKFHLQRGYCCGNGCKHCPYKNDAEDALNNNSTFCIDDEKK